eukprot:2722650-Amphidinium_carterae.1
MSGAIQSLGQFCSIRYPISVLASNCTQCPGPKPTAWSRLRGTMPFLLSERILHGWPKVAFPVKP